MKPDWDKLMAEFADSPTQLIGDVDCTAEGKPLCDANGVRGYPTIKWGDPADLQDYQGGRDFNSLKKFADENLKPVCSPMNIDLCDDDKKKQIQEFQALSAAEMDAKIEEYEKQLEEAEETFKSEVSKLQATYQKLSEEKDAKLAAVKDSGLGLLKSVKIAKAKAGTDEL
uniref:Thioredoxin domain-containing protein n=1 Tax=Amphora coffeiformis TaxID=265554 RepID=A0A7S3L5T3_9STRA|mmetsp:Transcript_2133/g.4647  ORF Transcript_2133/g.4647 Transcript_2133/m.4647 type:complete len:170 (-) Transcript_2133:341-850(-)|eukprot:scaffold6456_cov147-Amphora_coffeaeformis.AAC.1